MFKIIAVKQEKVERTNDYHKTYKIPALNKALFYNKLKSRINSSRNLTNVNQLHKALYTQNDLNRLFNQANSSNSSSNMFNPQNLITYKNANYLTNRRTTQHYKSNSILGQKQDFKCKNCKPNVLI